MLPKLSAKTHVALGQTFLLGTLLLGAIAMGLVPDRNEAVREGRTALAEALAVNGSTLVTQSNVKRLESTLELIVARNDDLESASVRHASGRSLVTIGDHTQHWIDTAGGASTDTQVLVPLWSGGQRWGQVELRFRSLTRPGLMGVLSDSRVQLMAFMSLSCFGVFYLYLRKMLQLLDPSQAVPPHVRSALDTLAEGLLIIDGKEQVVLANQAFAQLVGRTPEDLLGVSASEIAWSSGDGAPYPASDYPWSRALSEAELQQNDMIHLRDCDSVLRTFFLNCSPVLGSGGKPGGVLISMDDVTQLEEHKAELSAAKGEAEAANLAKSEFLANMSHEIRTPMNSILGFTDVLRRGYEKNEADRAKYLSTIRSSGEHLLQLINDVLDLSKVESGKIEIEQLRIAPHLLIQEVVTVLSVKAREKGIALTFESESKLPATILSDPTRLRQILTNLTSNAIRFTEKGGVRISARVVDVDEGRRFFIEVKDSGLGIPEDAREAIFDPFVQADTSVTRQFGGTGLGLPISRRFARLLGGDIVVHSEPGVGSTFAVIIDPGSLDEVEWVDVSDLTEAVDTGVALGSAQWEFPDARVLVVDDGEENRELVHLVLEEVGIHVEGAENGQVGVDMVRSGQFDLVLMDMQMPVMDGYTATQTLQAEGIDIPIIALTANAMKGFEKRCLDSGCSGYLVKPVDIDTLLEKVAGFLSGTRRSEPLEPVAKKPLEPMAESGEESPGGPLISRLASNPRIRPAIVKFVGRLDSKLEAMESALESGDLEELAQLGHWLKGSGGMVGFDAFHGPAANLEEIAREGKQDGIGAVIGELRDLAARLELPPEGEAK